jgi:hypothetical protein
MVVLIGRGHDRQALFLRAIEEFRAACASFTRPVPLLIDLREFANYEPAARDAWQAAFTDQRHNLTRIVYLGADAAFIRLASAAAVIIAGFKPEFIETWDGASVPPA